MERNFVLSSRIVTAAFEDKTGILEVEYFNGFVYQFLAVSSSIGNEILQSENFDGGLDALIAKNYERNLVEKLLPVYLG